MQDPENARFTPNDVGFGKKAGTKPRGIYSGAWQKRPISESPLQAYLKKHDVSRAEFSARVGASLMTVVAWCQGRVLPSLVYAYRIDEETGGEVSPAMWLGTELGRAAWKTIGGSLE